ncbi:MAG TPA: DHA2 family efflux MFS transporter permease subunit [Chryseosolibacter sp.]|nr:DHA2 family efflux MFS transporter permease subunit [Chryseosolibacter sp.]
MAKLSLEKWVIIFTVVSAALLQLIDTSIVNVSLIQMMGNMGATLGDISWVVTGYAASNVIMITLSGWLSSKFGRKNYFAASIILFTAASILCGQSHNVWELVIFRIIQGFGGGGLLSTAQAILIETFPKEDLGMANAIYGVGVIIGPTIGPTLGGYITDNYSWPWIFYINVPIGIIAAICTMLFIKEPAEKMKTGRMDWLAIIMLTVGIGALQVVLEKGESEDWFETPYIVWLTVASVVGLVAFIWRELVAKHPVVDLGIMRYRSFAVGSLFNFILGFGLFASVFIIPVFAQKILNFTATDTGLLLMPGSIMTGFMMPIVANVMKKKVSPYLLSGIGFLIFFIFTFMLSHLNLSAGPDDFFWPLIIRGFGLGMIFIPLTTISFAGLNGKEIPQGTALNNMIRQLGGSFGTAIMATYITTRTRFHVESMRQHISSYDIISQQRFEGLKNLFLSKGSSLMEATQQAYASLQGMLTKQALMLTYRDTFLIVGIFFLLCIPLLLLFIGGKKSGAQQHIEMNIE